MKFPGKRPEMGSDSIVPIQFALMDACAAITLGFSYKERVRPGANSWAA